MTTPHLAEDIAREEGREATAYPDPLSPLGRACAEHRLRLADYARLPARCAGLDGAPWTIGVGHTGAEVHRGLRWTDAQIDAQLRCDIARVKQGLDEAAPWWRSLRDPRQDVLVQMGFQMGVGAVLRFHATIGHLQAGAFDLAAESMLASAWARQTPGRAHRLAEQMRSGLRAGGAA